MPSTNALIQYPQHSGIGRVIVLLQSSANKHPLLLLLLLRRIVDTNK
jgi:hypothetical protein